MDMPRTVTPKIDNVVRDCKKALLGIQSCVATNGEYCKPNMSDMLDVATALDTIKEYERWALSRV